MVRNFSTIRALKDQASSTVRRFWRDEDGTVAMEYGIIATLIAVAIAATLLSIGETLRDSLYGDVATELEAANSAGLD